MNGLTVNVKLICVFLISLAGFSAMAAEEQASIFFIRDHDPKMVPLAPDVRNVKVSGPRAKSCNLIVARLSSLDTSKPLVDESGRWKKISDARPQPFEPKKPGAQASDWLGNIVFELDPGTETQYLVQAAVEVEKGGETTVIYSEPHGVTINGRLGAKQPVESTKTPAPGEAPAGAVGENWIESALDGKTAGELQPGSAMQETRLHSGEWNVATLFPWSKVGLSEMSGGYLFVTLSKDSLTAVNLKTGIVGKTLSLGRNIKRISPTSGGVVAELIDPPELVSIKNSAGALSVQKRLKLPVKSVGKLSSSESHKRVAFLGQTEAILERLFLADLDTGAILSWSDSDYELDGRPFDYSFVNQGQLIIAPDGATMYVEDSGKLYRLKPGKKKIRMEVVVPKFASPKIKLLDGGERFAMSYDLGHSLELNTPEDRQSARGKWFGKHARQAPESGVLIANFDKPFPPLGVLYEGGLPTVDPATGAAYSLSTDGILCFLGSSAPLSMQSNRVGFGGVDHLRFESIIGFCDGRIYVSGEYRNSRSRTGSRDTIFAIDPPEFTKASAAPQTNE